MARPVVLVATPFLIARRTEWAEGFELVEPSLLSKLVACFSTGYAGIDVDHLRARGVALTTPAGVNAHDIADHAIALMLGWWHGIPTGDRVVRDGQWRESTTPRSSLRGKNIRRHFAAEPLLTPV